MDFNLVITALKKNQDSYKSLLLDLDKDEYMWKDKSDRWCLLEICCHLLDEEKEDFRARTKHVLENPESTMPGIDPVNWVKERNYIQQNFKETVEAFLNERKASIEWLESLDSPNWKNSYLHPKLGPMSAKLFLSNWLAHDYLHIKQILKTKFDYLKTITGEELDYAGEWN